MRIVRKTKSVRIILEQFEHTNEAISVVDLVESLREEMNKTTVYRILDRLDGNGTLHSFMGMDGKKWYAKCKDCFSSTPSTSHPHFQCKVCGKVECLDFDIEIPILPDRRIESAELLLVGMCEQCISCDN
ncbi:MAG: transcriptional repressor [Bacteroidia bacterium]|nr:transcriptional repressor [Bacteroidia bacterium]